MNCKRATSFGFAIAATFGVLLAAGPAKADWHHGWHRGWHHYGWGWGPPAVIVAPRPYYPPPVVYAAPPPAYYAPPPVYYAPYAPGVSFGVTIH